LQPQEFGDQELIAGCLKNDSASWQSFVERFSRLVHWSIRKTLKSSAPGGTDEFIREVFQEFFERLLEKNELAKLRDANNVRKFLSVMACHMTLDKLKIRSRYDKKNFSIESTILSHDNVELGYVPQDPLLQQEFDGVFGGILEELSPKERACLEFYYEEGKTHLEISSLLGMPESTISSILRRCREKLKKKLSEKGYEI